MGTQIYYFTGTGNSLKIAKDIVKELGDTELISIPQVMAKDQIECSGDNLGIVFPVYCFGIPLIVVNFIKKLKIKENTYVFVVANHGAKPGPGGTVVQTKNLMKSLGIELGSIFTIEMINNYTPLFGVVGEEKQKEVFNKEKEKIKDIAEIVKNKKVHKPYNFFSNTLGWIMRFANIIVIPLAGKEDRKFWVDARCNSCGICERICPVNNIKLVDGKPTWLGNCQQCMSCFNFCPTVSIQYGKKSENCGRYRNPDITLNEILNSNSV